jgi:hypothetical protein
MKKIFFSILAISLLSTAAVFATGHKEAKKHHAKKTCPKNCPDTKDCHKTALCPIPGCVCSK